MFVSSVAGACLAGEPLVLEAIAAERMPHRIVTYGLKRAPFFELRDYGSADVGGVLNRQGLLPVYSKGGRYLFAFESLVAREQAWRQVRIDGAALREIALYRSV
jgi:hypothetical protein